MMESLGIGFVMGWVGSMPLAGAVCMWVLDPLGRSFVRAGALLFATVTLILALLLVAQFPVEQSAPPVGLPGEFAVLEVRWLPASAGVDVRLGLGLDGLSLWLFGLTALLMVTAGLVGYVLARSGIGIVYDYWVIDDAFTDLTPTRLEQELTAIDKPKALAILSDINNILLIIFI